MYEFSNFAEKIFNSVKPTLAIFSAIFSYLMFPQDSFTAWSIALWVAVALDLLTRWLAIFVKSKGVWNAFKTKTFNSDTLFRKTAIKVISYLVIQILAGLSMRLISIQQINTLMATIIYAFLFLREAASNIENLIDAGAEDLKPLLFWIKKKEKEVMKDDEG